MSINDNRGGTSVGFLTPNIKHMILYFQERTYEDIVEAVETFAASFQPPLLPALEGSSFETHISIEDNPPDYGTENGALKVHK